MYPSHCIGHFRAPQLAKSFEAFSKNVWVVRTFLRGRIGHVEDHSE